MATNYFSVFAGGFVTLWALYLLYKWWKKINLGSENDFLAEIGSQGIKNGHGHER